jgi:predicted GNAT family acetyltransferase
MTLTIEHLPQRHCFEAIVDGQRCVADYELNGAVMTITHTYVPPALEGRGIAGQLTEAMLQHARSHRLKVRPLCSYARAYMRRHPETLDLIA